ncbi:uncharacterized protein [Cherax quadricarinatus]|nr:uncharacterized protein LOC128695201 [Cherax quadricarinatus]
MAPKRKPGREGKRSSKGTGEKPSPKNLSQLSTSKKQTPARNATPSPRTRKQTQESLRGSRNSQNAPVQKYATPSQEETPLQKGTPVTPRSSGRYNLRNITPPSYSQRQSRVFNTPGRTPARNPSATPFRTPRLKTLAREIAPDLKVAEKMYKEESQIWKQHLRSFLHKTHKLCNLSSVYNFNYKTDGLRTKYEGILKKKVQEVYPSPLLTVKLATTACFTLKPGAVDAVHIHITSLVPGLTVDQDKTVTVYSSWLFRTSHVQCADIPGIEWFPIMLYTGRELIHHAVVEWLQGSFGCYITKYGIQQNALMWIAGVWSGRSCPVPSHQKDKENQMHFTYYIRPPSKIIEFSPPNARGKPKLVLKSTLKDIHHVWERVVDSSQDEMSITELREFFSYMDSIASESIYLPSSYLHLHQLYTPCIMLNGDGKVKLTCDRSASVLLNHLMDIFIQSTNCSALKDLLNEIDVFQDESFGSN